MTLTMRDPEKVISKFNSLLELADELYVSHLAQNGIHGDQFFKLYSGAKNLLKSVTTRSNTYSEELGQIVVDLAESKIPNPGCIKGILEAAKADYVDGFLADTKLL